MDERAGARRGVVARGCAGCGSSSSVAASGAVARRVTRGRGGARDGLVADAIALLAENARRNECGRDGVRRVGAPDALVARAPWDLVLAADVLYERRNVDELLQLLPRLGSTVLLADPGRPHAKEFWTRAAGAWKIEQSGIVYALTAAGTSTR